MHDESLTPRAYAKLRADRYLWQEQQERAARQRELLLEIGAVVDARLQAKTQTSPASGEVNVNAIY